MKVVVGLLACFGVASGQLRPRRVGTNAMGEQEATLTDVPTGGGDAMGAFGGAGGADPMAAMQQMLQGMGGEGGLDIMEMMKNNPMVQQMAQGNPEMMEMMNNPEKLAEQMQQVQELMGSAEGQGMMANMMKEMQNVMTDPDKLKAGLEQLATNPALKGFADAIPGMKEMLEDPDMLAEQASKVAEVMQSMGDPEKMKELLGADGENMMEGMQQMLAGMGGEGGMEGMQEAMQKMAGLMGGGDDALGALGGLGGDDEGLGGGDDLKARVREQMAQMMNKKRRGNALDEDEF